MKNRYWMGAGALVLAAAAVSGSYLWSQPTQAKSVATPSTAPAAPPPVANGTQELRFAAGAPQLDMLRAQPMPALPVPMGAALNARLVVDEDATARLGSGLAGRVLLVKAALGEQVRAGQLLAESDAPELGAAQADVDKARSDEARKRMVVERARVLGAGEGIAGRELEAAEADLVEAQAESARARQRMANLNAAGMRVRGQRLELVSPIAGVVVERAITPALEVGPDSSSPLFVVTDPRKLWLLSDVPEALVAQVRPGVRVDVESDAYPGEHFTATVMQRGQVVDPDTRRVVVRARLDNAAGKLLPEMFVRAALLQESGHAVRVPNGALVNRGLYTYVFVETAPGRYQRRQVTLLTRGGDNSYVGKGLVENERVVTTGALLLDAEMSARAGNAP